MNLPQLKSYGPKTILIEWSAEINKEIHNEVLSYQSIIQKHFKLEVAETVLAYNSLTLFLNAETDLNNFKTRLEEMNWSKSVIEKSFFRWEIPVCYDSDFAIDIEEVSKLNGIEIKDIIEIHSEQSYPIYFTGFLPGFLYLGGLDERIATPRKSTPDLSIPAGSVGIGGNQTGIYPLNSPGGWHIIGRTPIKLFNPNQTPPVPFSPGDQIKFKPIDKTEFDQIKKANLDGSYVCSKTLIS